VLEEVASEFRLGRPPSFRERGTMAPLLARHRKGRQGRSQERLDWARRSPRPATASLNRASL